MTATHVLAIAAVAKSQAVIMWLVLLGVSCGPSLSGSAAPESGGAGGESIPQLVELEPVHCLRLLVLRCSKPVFFPM